MNFRRGKYVLPWAYQYWLYKQSPMYDKRGAKRNGMMAAIIPACKSEKWSDDLGDGKPTKQP